MPTAPHSLTLAVSLILGTIAAAQPLGPDVSRLSLQDAVAHALANHPAVTIRREAIARREGLLQQAAGEFDLRITAEYGASERREPGIDRQALAFQSYLDQSGINIPALSENLDPFGDANITAVDDQYYTLALTQKLRNGITIRPFATAAINESFAPVVPAIGTGRVSLEIQVPLLRGLGRNDSGAREAAARGDIAVARLLWRHELARQASRTAIAYWTSRADDENIVIRRAAEERATQLVEIARTLVEASLQPPVMLARAEANLLDIRTQRLEAELAATRSRVALGQALGLPAERVHLVPRADDPFPEPSPAAAMPDPDYAMLSERALRQRDDFLALQQSSHPLAILVRRARLERRPRFDLIWRTGYASLSSQNDPLAAVRERRVHGNTSIAFSLDWPIRNRERRGELAQLQAEERGLEAEIEELGQLITGDVVSAWAETRLYAESLSAARDGARLAGDAAAQEAARLEMGESSMADLIELEAADAAARLRLSRAGAAYAISLTQLRFALGAIFESIPTSTDESFDLADLTRSPSP